MNTPIIVLRPQRDWHADATIDLNREGAFTLINRLQKVLWSNPNTLVQCDVFASHGEGYTLNIMRHSDDDATVLRPAYVGFPAELEAQKLRSVLEQIQKMADLGNTTGIDLEHAQSKLREIQRMAAEALGEGE